MHLDDDAYLFILDTKLFTKQLGDVLSIKEEKQQLYCNTFTHGSNDTKKA